MDTTELEFESIHHWFGLSYSSYFVMPRVAMQAMPLEWQKRFVALADEAYEEHGLETPAYHVLRDDPTYTMTKRYDEDDETSRVYEFTAVSDDPWANYRRGDIQELCPTFSAAPQPRKEGSK